MSILSQTHLDALGAFLDKKILEDKEYPTEQEIETFIYETAEIVFCSSNLGSAVELLFEFPSALYEELDGRSISEHLQQLLYERQIIEMLHYERTLLEDNEKEDVVAEILRESGNYAVCSGCNKILALTDDQLPDGWVEDLHDQYCPDCRRKEE